MKKTDAGLKKHLASVKALMKMRVGVGCVGMHDGGVENTDIMLEAEFGDGKNVPPRMPVRRTFNRGETQQFLQKVVEKTLPRAFKSDGGIDVMMIGMAVGQSMQQQLKATIQKGLTPGLAESTLERKERQGYSELPYIATKQFINSVEFTVKK